MIKNFTFGSDPEYFIRNKNTGKIVSSIPIIEGTKNKPEPLRNGFFILRDNILAEGNISPVKTKNEFIWAMGELKYLINEYIQTRYPVLEVYHADCLEIDEAFLSHPEAQMFGCSPYLNAWDNESHRANDLSRENFRTAGFHIHIGYDIEDTTRWNRMTLNSIIAKAFDIFVIIPSCLIHVDKRRFENYGGLGQYRDTSYGLECRSLGAYFVQEQYLAWIYDQTIKALEYVKKEENLYHLTYMAKPTVTFKGNIVSFDSSIYEDLDLSLDEQLIKTNNTVHA